MEDRSSRRMRTLVTRMVHRDLTANETACALISMMARSTKLLQSEAGYIDARPQCRQIDETLLRRTAGPYIRAKGVVPDPARTTSNVRYAPIPDEISESRRPPQCANLYGPAVRCKTDLQDQRT